MYCFKSYIFMHVFLRVPNLFQGWDGGVFVVLLVLPSGASSLCPFHLAKYAFGSVDVFLVVIAVLAVRSVENFRTQNWN